MTRTKTPRTTAGRAWLLWTTSFLALPAGGYLGSMIGGRVDNPLAAAIGGAVAGLVIGAVQVLASSHRLRLRTWIPATVLGMSAGLALGAAAVDYRTTLTDLALMGAVNGLILGMAQAFALPTGLGRRRLIWAGAMPALWSLGWTVTTLMQVSVDRQFIVFGASGAVLITGIAGILLNYLIPVPPATQPAIAPITAKASS